MPLFLPGRDPPLRRVFYKNLAFSRTRILVFFFGSGWPFFKSVYTGVNELGRGWVHRKRARVSTRANQPSSATARPLEDSRPGQKHPVLKCTTDDKTTNDKRRTAATHTALDAHRVEERLVVRAVGIPAAGVVAHRLLCGGAVLAD